MKYLKIMRIKISLIFLLCFSFCSNIQEEVSQENIQIFNLDLNSLTDGIDLQLNSEFLVINYWASWCLECIEEHELLITLAETQKLENKVIMVSFQDNNENAIEFLNNYGYGKIIYAIDDKSKLAIDSGVFGVPETHIIIDGEIVQKFIGPLNLSNIEEIINNYP